MVYRLAAWLALFLGATVVGADQPPPPITAATRSTPGPVLILVQQAGHDKAERTGSALETLNQVLEQLKAERQAIRTIRDEGGSQAEGESSSNEDLAAQLRHQLGDLMTKLLAPGGRNQKKTTDMAATGEPEPDDPPEAVPSEDATTDQPVAGTKSNDAEGPALPPAAGPVDPIALAQALFRTGDFEGALKAYRMVDLSRVRPEVRVGVQYLMANCLRKTGNSQGAAVLYREVANFKGDEILAGCARWQLNAIRWRHDSQAQIEQLRQRRQSLQAKP